MGQSDSKLTSMLGTPHPLRAWVRPFGDPCQSRKCLEQHAKARDPQTAQGVWLYESTSCLCVDVRAYSCVDIHAWLIVDVLRDPKSTSGSHLLLHHVASRSGSVKPRKKTPSPERQGCSETRGNGSNRMGGHGSPPFGVTLGSFA